MQNFAITVFTPTYNRAMCLPALYRSLCAQTSHDFVWLIVDDGSTDDTGTVVDGFLSEGKITVRYHKRENGGKYRAHNTGVLLADTELFVCVDSDDTLAPDAVEKTLAFWKTAPSGVAGIVSPKKMKNGTSCFRHVPAVGELRKLYAEHRIVGETMLVYRTEVLRRHLFPELFAEKFMPEAVVYFDIDREAPLATQDAPLYLSDYLDDGLTKNIFAVQLESPNNVLLCYKFMSVYCAAYRQRALNEARYLAWRRLLSLEKCDRYRTKFLTVLGGALLFPAVYRKMKRQKAMAEKNK